MIGIYMFLVPTSVFIKKNKNKKKTKTKEIAGANNFKLNV